jgi:hypothetical protein
LDGAGERKGEGDGEEPWQETGQGTERHDDDLLENIGTT